MKGATTIQECLWELRKDKGLNLEELSQKTGISKSALASYESDDNKEINHGSLIALADFYEVSIDYLFCRTENREQINTPLSELHLTDEAVELLKSGRINNRLLCEIVTNDKFEQLMTDTEIYIAECFGKIFQGGGFAAAEENLAVHVAHDGIRIILVDGFQLAAGLQDKASRNLSATDGGYQLFQLRNLTNVGTLVDQAADMDRQLTAVHIIGFVAEQIKKLGVNHTDKEIERTVRIAHDKEQRRFPVAQLVQFQFIVHGGIPNFLNVEGRKPGTAGNKDGLGRFAGSQLIKFVLPHCKGF